VRRNSSANVAAPQFEFGVEVEPSGGFDAPRLDLAVGQRVLIALLAGEALDVDGDESLVGEDDRVAHSLEGEVYSLAVDEHRRQFGGYGPGITRPELEERTVVERRSWAAR
jgi:hypothetical protein